jgi:predicted amidohydrolase
MPNIKITLFQKNINTGISREQKDKLIAQKSDFLVLPPFFPNDTTSTFAEIASLEKVYLDRIYQISEYYKGIILGGSMLRQIDGKFIESCPIVKDINLIDWYNSRTTKKIGKFSISAHETENIFILNGIRFAIFLDEDISRQELLEEITKEGIFLIFNPFLQKQENNEPENYTKQLTTFPLVSQKNNFHILRVSGPGEVFGTKLCGRSYYSSPTGIKWKVSQSEGEQEIIKTVNVSF